jgi:hypothetical protein
MPRLQRFFIFQIGTHLFCVYGDNWFQTMKYTLQVMIAVDPSKDQAKNLQVRYLCSPRYNIHESNYLLKLFIDLHLG